MSHPNRSQRRRNRPHFGVAGRCFTRRIGRRNGFSLLEFSVASLVVGILMIGLSSSIHLVTRAAQLSEGPANRTTEAARCLEEVIADLRLAQVFKERTENSVTFTVPDRDGDAAAEEITLRRDAGGDGSLQRTILLSAQDEPSTSQVLFDRVNDLHLEYEIRRWGPPPPEEEIESEERLLIAHDDFPQENEIGRRVLMVVDDASQPGSQEAARGALLEGWGFTVEWISDDASQSEFDSATSRHDVVYVCETCLSAQVDEKLRGTTLGIVNEEPYLTDELGIANDLGRAESGTLLESNVGTHLLNYGWLPDAPVAIFTDGQPSRNLTADPDQWAPDLEVLATRSGEPALAVLPAGGELYRRDSNKDQRLGETEVLDEQSNYWDFADRYVANRWTLTQEAECFSLAAHLSIPSGRRVRFGIYTDNNGEPGTLVQETDRYRASWNQSQWVTVDFDEPVSLQPGNYWLAVGMEPYVRIRYENEGGLARWADTGRDPTKGMMQNWTDTYGPSDNDHRYSMYANYDIIERAPGRRVQLPWGTDHLQVASLSEQGQDLLRRSLEWAADASPHDQGAEWRVTSSAWPAQYLFPSLPTNVTGWKLTRLFCQLRADSLPVQATVGFRLTHGDLQQLPSAFEIQDMDDVDLDGLSDNRFRWFEIPIDVTGDLRPDRGICFVVQGFSGGTNVFCRFDQGDPDTASTRLCESWNSGNQWSAGNPTHDLRFYAYGKFLTAGEPTW